MQIINKGNFDGEVVFRVGNVDYDITCSIVDTGSLAVQTTCKRVFYFAVQTDGHMYYREMRWLASEH